MLSKNYWVARLLFGIVIKPDQAIQRAPLAVAPTANGHLPSN